MTASAAGRFLSGAKALVQFRDVQTVMKIFIGYATSEGQTRKIARFAADHLTAQGHAVELLSLEDAEGLEIGRFDAAILAGSVHAGSYQRALRDFATKRGADLAGVDDLFLSVSLTAGGENAEDWAALQAMVDSLVENSGWAPDRVEHVAGAFRFSEYNLLEKFIMRRIASAKDPTVDTSTDTELTDWARVADILDDWAGSIGPQMTEDAT